MTTRYVTSTQAAGFATVADVGFEGSTVTLLLGRGQTILGPLPVDCRHGIDAQGAIVDLVPPAGAPARVTLLYEIAWDDPT